MGDNVIQYDFSKKPVISKNNDIDNMESFIHFLRYSPGGEQFTSEEHMAKVIFYVGTYIMRKQGWSDEKIRFYVEACFEQMKNRNILV